MVDTTLVEKFAAEYSVLVDALQQLKNLEPPRAAEGIQGLEAWFREFQQSLRTISMMPDAECLKEFAEDVDAALSRIGGAVPPPPPPQDEPLLQADVTLYGIKRGKVLALYNEAGAGYTDYDTDGFIHFLLVAPQIGDTDEFSEEEEDYLYIKATEIGAAATGLPAVGYVDIAADDEIGYILGGLLEQVPGLAPFFPFHGQLYLCAGKEGARLGSAYELFGGPGITVTAVEDSNQHKASVELSATSPGLEFDAAGDAGKLRVKPDTTKGIDVGAAGVRIDLATDPGLQFTGGDLAVKPNAAKAIVVEAAGVGVVANAAKAIAVDASGVGVVANAAKGIAVDADGVQLKIVDGAEGLEWDAGTLRTKPDTSKAINYSDDGICLVIDTNYLEFNAGTLRHTVPFGEQQFVTVRNAAGDGTTTLMFDTAGHYDGIYG